MIAATTATRHRSRCRLARHSQRSRVLPGGIAARPRQATDQARADRVDDATKHDRHGAGRRSWACSAVRAVASTYWAAERNWLARSDPYDIRPPALTK